MGSQHVPGKDTGIDVAPADATGVSAQLRGETMAYAAQSAVYNIVANFFEPYIGTQVQKRFSGADAAHPGKHGTYVQNMAGEFAGDLIGSSTLMLAEAVAPNQLHACTRTMRGWIDPFYTKIANHVFADEKDEPGCDEKIAKWKLFQERNLVRSSIIATAGIAGNVATQKLLIGNPSSTKLILAGKLASTAVTTGLGLGMRMAFPQPMNNMDKWMSKKVFAPMMDDKTANAAPPSHVEKLAQQGHAEALQPGR